MGVEGFVAKTVYTGGTFDLFHAGHVELLRRCAEFGPVTVALNTDEFIAAYKPPGPTMSYEERKIVLEACRYVSRVVANSRGADSRPTLEEVGPDLIVVGSDWLKRDYLGQLGLTAEWLEERGIGLVYLPYTQGVSTSNVRRRLADRSGQLGSA